MNKGDEVATDFKSKFLGDAEFMKTNNIKTKANLPFIKFHEDMIARCMGLSIGDIVKITRSSPSAGEYVSYRICVP